MYPEQAPLRTFTVPTDSAHSLHVEEWGNPSGMPVALLHGGPGSGSSSMLRRLLDPVKFRVICVDQRGAGRSTPSGDIQDNTTAHLVADIENIRKQLFIDSWLLVGGSWGATLALAAAIAHTESVWGLVLRASFLARQQDIHGFFAGGPKLLSDRWRHLPELALDAALEVVQYWFEWEHFKSGATGPAAPPRGAALANMYHRYRIQSHYLRNGCWLQDPPLLDRLEPLRHVPIRLLHGAEDNVCPLQGAIELAAKLPSSTLAVVPSAGHDPTHPAMRDAMMKTLAALAMPSRGCARRINT
jgi:proline iminopeptidase